MRKIKHKNITYTHSVETELLLKGYIVTFEYLVLIALELRSKVLNLNDILALLLITLSNTKHIKK